jgi:hypothetical protein
MENINWDRVQTFADLNDPNDLDWLKGTVKELQENMELKIGIIDGLVLEPNRDSLLSVCHQIKGVTSNFGLDKINDVSVKAEAILKTDNWIESITLLKSLKILWKDANTEIIKKLDL